jgi:hypothetical protein
MFEASEPIIVNPGEEKHIDAFVYVNGVFLDKTSELNIILKICAIAKNITIKMRIGSNLMVRVLVERG